MGVTRVAALLCISRLVGMECPGLHSMIAGIDLQVTAEGAASCVSYSAGIVR